jgi:hypothetical protein
MFDHLRGATVDHFAALLNGSPKALREVLAANLGMHGEWTVAATPGLAAVCQRWKTPAVIDRGSILLTGFSDAFFIDQEISE